MILIMQLFLYFFIFVLDIFFKCENMVLLGDSYEKLYLIFNYVKRYVLHGTIKENVIKTRKGLSFYRDSNGTHNYKLYNTVILSFNMDNEIVLNTDGWETKHSKNCINDNLPEGYRVYQKNFEWFVETPQETLKYYDNMVIKLDVKEAV